MQAPIGGERPSESGTYAHRCRIQQHGARRSCVIRSPLTPLYRKFCAKCSIFVKSAGIFLVFFAHRSSAGSSPNGTARWIDTLEYLLWSQQAPIVFERTSHVRRSIPTLRRRSGCFGNSERRDGQHFAGTACAARGADRSSGIAARRGEPSHHSSRAGRQLARQLSWP